MIAAIFLLVNMAHAAGSGVSGQYGTYGSIDEALSSWDPVITVDATKYSDHESLVINYGVSLTAINGRVELDGLKVKETWFDFFAPTHEASLTNFDVRPSSGRGLYVTQSDLLLTDVTIEGGDADYGGGLRSYSAKVTCVRCEISDGHADFYGGDVYVGMGSIFTATDSVFDGGTADDYDGGNIYVDDSSGAYLTGGVVSGGSAMLGGGVGAYGPLVVTGVTFDDNEALFGGAIYTGSSYGYAVIHDATFTKNHATGSGGAIATDGVVQVMGGLFTDNTADLDGGAVSGGALIEVAWSRFCRNEAGKYGGAIHGASVFGSYHNNRYADNHAKHGGGLAVLSSPGIDLAAVSRNETFVDNHADVAGAAVWGESVFIASDLFYRHKGVATVAGELLGVLGANNLFDGNDKDSAQLAQVLTDSVYGAPRLSWTDDGDCTNDALTLLPDSAAIGTGWKGTDGALLNADLSSPDIGAYGGPELDPLAQVVYTSAYDPGLDEDIDDDEANGIYDCRREDPLRSPFFAEQCGNAIDDDCDEVVDDHGSEPVYPDADLDGVGAGEADYACGAVGAAVGGDCADDSAAQFPGNDEVCDGLDNDCDAATPELCPPDDDDDDDTGAPVGPTSWLGGGGCAHAPGGSTAGALALALAFTARRRPRVR